MRIFGSGSGPVIAWGPVASMDVKIGGLPTAEDWVLVGMSAGAQEITDIRQCFNEVSYIYALGNDQSKCAISLVFAVFFGRKNCKGGDNMKAVLGGFKSYSSMRISKKLSPTNIVIGGFAADGWMCGIHVGQVDAQRSVCYVEVSFIMKLPGAS